MGHILSLRAGGSFDQLVNDIIRDVLAMDSTGMRMNTSGISVPEDIKSRYAKGHIAGKEVNLGVCTGNNSVGRRNVFYNQ